MVYNADERVVGDNLSQALLLQRKGEVMFSAGTLSLREFIIGEVLPLATLQRAILEFLRGRDDAVVFGAQAINAYVSEPRSTQGIDLLSSRAEPLAEELRAYLAERFHIAVRVRRLDTSLDYRVDQLQKPRSRHLVDIRGTDNMPASQRLADILVIAPAQLIATKVIAFSRRKGQPKSGTDWRDVAILLLTFPELKCHPSPVTDALQAGGATEVDIQIWTEKFVSREIEANSEWDDSDE